MTDDSRPDICTKLSQRGLVVSTHFNERNELIIVRPATAGGTTFPEHSEPRQVGLNDVFVFVNAPEAKIRLLGERDDRCEVEISIHCCGGPDYVFFRETFSDLHTAADAVIDCYFGKRIDFQNIPGQGKLDKL
jgi:hypothetical protein